MSNVEAQLWSRWRQRRNESAFEQLIRPHLRFLRGFACRLGCAAADADDVVQKALVRLAQDDSATPVTVGLRAWLGRTVLSETRMLFRARKRRRHHESRSVGADRRVDDAASIDRRDEVEVALQALPETERRAVVLRFLHDLDYAEVSYILGITRRAARLRVHRGVARLRKRLGPHAVAALAALPLLGGEAVARTALAQQAARAAVKAGLAGTTTVSTLGGAVLMTTTAKIALGICAALVASLLAWRANTERPVRSTGRTARAALPASPVDSPGRESADGEETASEDEGGARRDARIRGHEPIPAGKGSVIGRVTFEDGEPLRRTKLALWGASEIVTETDDDGNYHIHGDWVGDRDVTIVGPRGFAFSIGIARMKKDERITVDLVLDRGVELVGSVGGRLGEVVQEPRVVLRRPDAHSQNPLQGGYGQVKPGPDGNFRFPYLPDGKYSLLVTAKGYESWSREFTVEGRVDRFDAVLKRARPLVIRFENLPASARGIELSWSLQRAAPMLMMISGKGALDDNNELHADAPGKGKFVLMVHSTEFTPRVRRDIEFDEQPPEPVVVVLPKGGAVEGVVRGPDGEPLAGVRIDIKGASSPKTGANGRFALEWVPNGEHTVWLRDGGTRVSLGRKGFPVASREFAVQGRSSLKLTLPGNPTWHNSFVEVWVGDRKLATARPGDGPAIHFRWLPAGRLKLLLLADGYAFEKRWIDLHDNTHKDMGVVDLAKYVEVPVWVMGAGTVRFLTFTTALRNVGPDGRVSRTQQSGSVTLDENGRGILKGLPAGTHSVTIHGRGRKPFQIEITLREGQVDPIPIKIPER